MIAREVSGPVVDDDRIDTMAVSRSFRELGIAKPVIEARDGIEGWRACGAWLWRGSRAVGHGVRIVRNFRRGYGLNRQDGKTPAKVAAECAALFRLTF
jgi:hypothetical protein